MKGIKMSQTIIKKDDIPAIIAEISRRGARPISVYYEIDQPLLMKDRRTGEENEHKSCTKIGAYLCFLNFSYQNSVNRARFREGKEGNFVAKENWFAHSETRAILYKKSNPKRQYLQLKVQRRIVEPIYKFENGKEKTEGQLKGLLPLESFPENQGLESPVYTISIALESIRKFTCDGKEYVVEKEKKKRAYFHEL